MPGSTLKFEGVFLYQQVMVERKRKAGPACVPNKKGGQGVRPLNRLITSANDFRAARDFKSSADRMSASPSELHRIPGSAGSRSNAGQWLAVFSLSGRRINLDYFQL